MVYRKISQDMKERALQLLQDGWDLDDIVDALGMSGRSISRWSRNLKLTGHISSPWVQRGRLRLLNAAAIDDLCGLISETPSLFLDEIGEWLALYHDIPISTTALHNTLRDMGFSYKVLKRTAAQRDEEQRSAWRDEVANNLSREQLVFLDESSKDGRTFYRTYGRGLRGSRAVEQVPFERSSRWSILPALSLDGYIGLRIVPGSVDGGAFFDFVVEDVVRQDFPTIRSTDRLFQLPQMQPYPSRRSILVMDNCNIHKSNALREAVEAAGKSLKT
jgi:transposase